MSRAALFSRTSLALLGLTLFAPSALSSVTVDIEQDGFGSGRIEVTSKDGKSWTDITPGTFRHGRESRHGNFKWRACELQDQAAGNSDLYERRICKAAGFCSGDSEPDRIHAEFHS